jgi:hypothetical protein
MCLAYFLYLILYAFKLSIYLSNDDENSLIKFTVYDSIENFVYGEFMCKMTSSAPVFIKLLSRFSLLLIVARRLLIKLSALFNRNESSSIIDFLASNHSSPNYSLNENELGSRENRLNVEECADTNILKNMKKKNKYILNDESRRTSVTNVSFIDKIFIFPLLNIFILVIWVGSFVSSLPLYLTYKLDKESKICDSTYQFPDDIQKFASIHLHYLIYGLALPVGLTFLFLIVLFVLNFNCVDDSSSINHIQNKKIILTSKIKNDSSVASCTSSSIDELYANMALVSRAKNNNSLLWTCLCVILFTSLPPELYRYLQLNINLKDDEILENYLESIFVQPVMSARPYYGMQLLYVSEFALLPLIFLLYYKCSTSFGNKFNSTTLNSLNNNNKNGGILSSPKKYSSSVKNLSMLLFYDNELYKKSAQKYHPDVCKTANKYSINSDKNSQDALLSNNNSSTVIATNPFYQSKADILMNKKQKSQEESSENSNNGQLVHIIQHPSWRINIKQPQHQSALGQQLPILNKNNLMNSSNNNVNRSASGGDSSSGPVQLPFIYKKTTNMYNKN